MCGDPAPPPFWAMNSNAKKKGEILVMVLSENKALSASLPFLKIATWSYQRIFSLQVTSIVEQGTKL